MDGTASRGPLLAGVTIMNLAVSCVFVFARVLTRTYVRPQWGLDDALIVVTLCVFIGFCTSVLVSVHSGFGAHLATLSPSSAQSALRASTVGEIFAVWTYPTGKAAVACLLMRVFPWQRLKWLLWSFVAVNAVFFYLNGVLLLVECRPVAFQWDKTIPGGSCWNPEVLVIWGYITGSVGAATDLTFAIVPWFNIAHLQMSLRRKLAIGVALGAGLVPFVCSILKIYYTSNLGSDADPTYSTVDLTLAGNSELCAINIAACIPTLPPLVFWLRKKFSRRPSSSARDSPEPPQDHIFDGDVEAGRRGGRKSNHTLVESEKASSADDKSELGILPSLEASVTASQEDVSMGSYYSIPPQRPRS